ncbi:sensor histidine kinase [Microvirga pudoricolor]|uniref:sensor histidine kinase n=1 Tax=Microvirga pudoricolor TaxID=2778729 RepID=UPI001952712A|nr:HWE histidine kinase domain-containing protein [Microvirga pudoricolor]MBM6594352.1 PAS domain-containing protein [Microvirga pudoricolor]
MSLTRRLLLVALISVLPAIVIWTYTEVSLRRAREAEINGLALRQAQLAASEIERIFEGVRSLLVAVEEVPSVRDFNGPACTSYLGNLRAKVPYLDAVVVLDPNGLARCQHGSATYDGFADKPYFRDALKTGDLVVGDFTRVRLNAPSTRPILPLALAFQEADGSLGGVVVAALDLDWLGQQLSARAVPQDGSLTIADRNGVIIARQPLSERFIGTRIPDGYMSYVSAPASGAFEALSQDGVKRVIGYVPATLARGVYVSAGISSKVAFDGINRAAKRGFLLIAAALLLALSLSGLIGRAFVTKPFDTMLKAVRAWRRGNYDARIGIRPAAGEFGMLASAFNDLMNDVSERQKALQASEERARLALDAGQMGTWWFDHDTKTSGWSPQLAQLFGQPSDKGSVTVAEWQSYLHPDEADAAVAKLRASVSRDGEYEDEYRIRRPDGEVRWVSARGRTFFNTFRQPVTTIGVIQDVTARKLSQDQQQLLLDELNHRVKNTLATVQSIASQTLRSSKDSATFKKAFESRLLALSKTHDLLTRNSWRDADLHAIAEQELAPYRRENGGRVFLRGPRVNLPARMVISFGLIIHELVTNAAKYGALSNASGQIELRWVIESAESGRPQLRLVWTETNGPPVTEPAHQGFGSRLIRRSVEGELNGGLTMDYEPAGLVCEIVVPLD